MKLAVLLALILAMAAPAHAGDGHDAAAAASGFDEEAAMRSSASAVGRPVGDYPLLDRDGRSMQFSRYRGKPLLLSFVYTKCAQTCPMTTRNLSRAVKAMQEAFGADSFAVLSVGFDADADTPQAMRSFAKRQQVDLPGWEFASADARSTGGLARAVGFSYSRSPAGYDHISQLTIVDPEGIVYRQIYGDDFELPMLGEPLKILIGGAPAHYPLWQGLGRRIRLFCTTYDPGTGRYRADYSFFVGMLISAAMILPFGYWIVRELRRTWGAAGGGA